VTIEQTAEGLHLLHRLPVHGVVDSQVWQDVGSRESLQVPAQGAGPQTETPATTQAAPTPAANHTLCVPSVSCFSASGQFPLFGLPQENPQVPM